MSVPGVLSRPQIRNQRSSSRENNADGLPRRELGIGHGVAAVNHRVEVVNAKALAQWGTVYHGESSRSLRSEGAFATLGSRKHSSYDGTKGKAPVHVTEGYELATLDHENEQNRSKRQSRISIRELPDPGPPGRRSLGRTTTCQAQKRRTLQQTNLAHEQPEVKRPSSILSRQSTSTSHAGTHELYVVDEVPDCDVSVVAAADEIADPSREAMLREVISPWSSQTNLLEAVDADRGSDCSNGLVGRVPIESCTIDDAGDENEPVIMEDDPERLPSPTESFTHPRTEMTYQSVGEREDTNAVATLDVDSTLSDGSPDDADTSQHHCISKPRRVHEWATQLNDAEESVLEDVLPERSDSPGIPVQRVLPDLFLPARKKTPQDEDRNDSHWGGSTVDLTVKSLPEQKSKALSRSISTPSTGKENWGSRKQQRVSSLPVLNDACHRQTSFTSLRSLLSGGNIGSASNSKSKAPEDDPYSPTSIDSDDLPLSALRKILKAGLDPDSLTPSEHRQVLQAHRKGTERHSHRSSRYGTSERQATHVANPPRFDIDTGTRRKSSNPGPDRSKRQSSLLQSWRHSLATVREPDENRHHQEERRVAMMQQKQADIDVQQQQDFHRQTQQAIKDGMMIMNTAEVNAAHRKVMRRLQRDAVLKS